MLQTTPTEPGRTRGRQKVSVGNELPTITRQQTGRPKAEKFPPKCYSQIVTETPRPWDRRSTETTKAYAAFRAYIALGARRSVREAARQYHSKTIATGEISSAENTTVGTWMGWSSKNAWVSRANARDEWIARTSDDQIIVNILACKLALVTRAHDFLTSTDSEVFLRGARAFTLQHPPTMTAACPDRRRSAIVSRYGRSSSGICGVEGAVIASLLTCPLTAQSPRSAARYR